MANTKTGLKPNPLNGTFPQEIGSQTDEAAFRQADENELFKQALLQRGGDQVQVGADENDLFSRVLARTGDNPDGTPPSVQTSAEQPPTEQELLDKNRAIERSRDINPVQETEIDVFTRKQAQDAQDTQELTALQQQFADMAQVKGMSKTERPKIVEARVVEPGERKYVFADLMNSAMRKIKAFVAESPDSVFAQRQGKLKGHALQKDIHNDLNNPDGKGINNGA